MSEEECLKLLNEFKNLVINNKEKAYKMLLAHPGLSRALIKIELYFGMIQKLPKGNIPKINIKNEIKAEKTSHGNNQHKIRKDPRHK